MHPSRRIHPDVEQWLRQQGLRVIDVGEPYVDGDKGHSRLINGSLPPRHLWADFDLAEWELMALPDTCRPTHRLAVRRHGYPLVTQPVDAMLKGLVDAETAYTTAVERDDLYSAGKALDVYHVILNQLRHAIEASEERVRRATEEAACVKQD
jgi:hypothetical protein